MLQVARFTVFTVSGLSREEEKAVKNILAPSQISVSECPEKCNRVEVGNGNFQHKYMFVKYLCRVSSQRLN